MRDPDERGGGWVRSVLVEAPPDRRKRFPWTLPALRGLTELVLDPAVTFLVGENASGKSTLLEAVAVAAGFNAEGGSRNFSFSTRDSTSPLHEHVRLSRRPARPRTGFFLRAESFFNVATAVEELGPEIAGQYGNRSLHEQSHGESFLSLVVNRFGPRGLYLMDEPESALSPRGLLALVRAVHDLVDAESQFVIATHSPLLLATPGALIYELGEHGIDAVSFDDVEHVQLYRSFLESPQRFLRPLLEDD